MASAAARPPARARPEYATGAPKMAHRASPMNFSSGAASLGHARRQQRHRVAHDELERLGVELLGQLREARHVGEEHRDDAPLALGEAEPAPRLVVVGCGCGGASAGRASSDSIRVVRCSSFASMAASAAIAQPAVAHRAARRARPPSPPTRWRRRPAPRRRSRPRPAARRRRRGSPTGSSAGSGCAHAGMPGGGTTWVGERRLALDQSWCRRPVRRRPPADRRHRRGRHRPLGPGGVGGEVLVDPRQQLVALGGREGDAGDELLGRQLEHDGVADGTDRCRARRAPQDADLAEGVAGGVRPDHPFGAVRQGLRHLEVAALHHEEVRRRIALLDHRLAGGDLHLGELRVDVLADLDVEAGEVPADVAARLTPKHLGRVERLVGGPAAVDERRAEGREQHEHDAGDDREQQHRDEHEQRRRRHIEDVDIESEQHRHRPPDGTRAVVTRRPLAGKFQIRSRKWDVGILIACVVAPRHRLRRAVPAAGVGQLGRHDSPCSSSCSAS